MNSLANSRMWIVIALIGCLVLVGVSSAPAEPTTDPCKEKCKNTPDDYVCGRKAVKPNVYRYQPFRNECELMCNGYEKRVITACKPIETEN